MPGEATEREGPLQGHTAGNEDSPRRSPGPTAEEQATLDSIPTPTALAVTARYELLGEVGRGGMGIVYKARDRETGDLVALKVMKPEIAADQAAVERFKNELLLARKITHKHVCRIHELLRFGDTVAISMEYIEGESLRAFLRRYGSASIRTGIEWARQNCAALAEAHAQGVVHRDLKPENIMITGDGEVKVMDFGMARSLAADTLATATISGTPAYMSPEQAQGKKADARSDIYSLGMVMYELFTGKAALRAETPVALALKQIHETPTAPLEVEPHLPAFLDRAIRKCLEKDPGKRFQAVVDLEAALSEQPAAPVVEAGEPEVPPRLANWQRSDYALLLIGIAGLLCFLALHDRVLPVSQMRLQIDALGARRVAEDAAARLKQRFPPLWEAELQPRTEAYREWLEARFFLLVKRPVRTAWTPDLAAWRLSFSSWDERALAGVQAAPQHFAVIDTQGKVERIYFAETSVQVPAGYQAPGIEVRRAAARQALEAICGPPPAAFQLRETIDGERRERYTVAWRPRSPGTPFVPQVTLVAEGVVDVYCRQPAVLPDVQFIVTFTKLRTYWANGVWLFRILFCAGLLAAFLVGRSYNWPLMRNHLPLAVCVGLAGTWLFAGGLMSSLAAGPFVVLIVGVAAIGLVWIGLATVEQQSRRWAPQRIATYALLWRGRVLEPAVGLAVVRGALAGIGLAGLRVLMARGGLALVGTWWTRRGPGFMSPVFLDPDAVGQALASVSPAGSVLGFFLFTSVVLGIIAAGLPLAYYSRKYAREKVRRQTLWVANQVGAVILFGAWDLHLADFLPRPMGTFFGLVVFAVLLAWLVVRYDLLTAAFAIGTAVLWNVNYPLLIFFREVGNSAYWAIFVGWGLLVLLAAAVAFRSALARARQRLVSDLQ
jgi:predicted Ser/Thr protein kinase